MSKSTPGGGPSKKKTADFGAVFKVKDPSSFSHLSFPAKTLIKAN
jgi:hypothetical protein